MSTSDAIDCCAACGKGGDGLKTCTACKLVKYCSVVCQKSHRPFHKKQCKKRAAEIFDEALFKEPPPRDDCPICFIPLSSRTKTTYKNCCGQNICDGCMISVETKVCPFCREPNATTDEENIERTKRRMELNDHQAFYTMGCHYHGGWRNLIPQDYGKARELWSMAAELGSSMAHCNLATRCYYKGEGVKKDLKKATHHWELAAIGGQELCRYNLGIEEEKKGNIRTRAIKHYIIAARAGYDKAMAKVRNGYMNGYVSKNELEKTMRAYQKSLDDVKSAARDKAVVYRAHEEEYHASLQRSMNSN